MEWSRGSGKVPHTAGARLPAPLVRFSCPLVMGLGKQYLHGMPYSTRGGGINPSSETRGR